MYCGFSLRLSSFLVHRRLSGFLDRILPYSSAVPLLYLHFVKHLVELFALDPAFSFRVIDIVLRQHFLHTAFRRSRQFIMSDRYAYDITDYSINSPDSLFTTPAYEGQITQINKWLNDSREVFLIMQSSYPYKYQRSYEW